MWNEITHTSKAGCILTWELVIHALCIPFMINFKFSCGSEHIDRWCGKPKKYSCPYWERTHTQRVSSICERKQTHIHEKEFKRVLNVRVRTEKHTDRWRGNTRTGDLSLSFTGFSFTHYFFIYLPSLSLTLDSFVCHFHRTLHELSLSLYYNS